MSYAWIRQNFGVNPRVGQIITKAGQYGVIVHTDLDPMYLQVRFDGSDHAVNVHPTWEVDYNPPPASARAPAKREMANV